MAVVGFAFTQIHAEKSEATAQRVSLNTNVAVVGVERVPLAIGAAKEEALKLSFQFESSYQPKLGSITLKGFVLYLDSKEGMNAIEKAWKKDKKLPKDLHLNLLNHIHSKCCVEAITISKDIGLPPPIPFPRINIEEKAAEK